MAGSVTRRLRGGLGPSRGLLGAAMASFAAAALTGILMLSGESWVTIVGYVLLAFASMMVYYLFFMDSDFIESLAFPAFAVLMIQCLVYPFYVVMSGNSRAYLFHNQEAVLFPAMLLWLLGVVGFGVGLGLRRAKRAVAPANPETPAHALPRGRTLLWVTLPLMAASLFAAYLKYRAYGYGSLEDIAHVGAFSADVIRRSRGLGPLTLLEMWSYVAVAYVGWHAYLHRKFWRSSILLGLAYAVAGSALSLLNARRSAIVLHLLLLLLPFLLNAIRSRRVIRALLPMLLVSMFMLDLASSALRVSYYVEDRIDWTAASTSLEALGYAPLSFDQLELSAALIQKLESEEFTPLGGTTIIAGALNWVPRAIWPAKPWTGGPVFAVAMGGRYYFDDAGSSSSMTTGLIVEMLLNFGLFAFALTPVAMAGVGYWLSGVDVRRFVRGQSALRGAALSIYFWSAAGLFSDDIGGVVTKIVMNTAGLVLVYVLTRAFAPRHVALAASAPSPSRRQSSDQTMLDFESDGGQRT